MAGGLTLDAGALIAHDRADQRMRAILTTAVKRGVVLTVPTLVIAQVWRGNNPRIAQLLRGCAIEGTLDAATARTIGQVLAESRTSDVVDAVVAFGAIRRRDSIVTSDPKDMEHLIDAVARVQGPPSAPIRRHVKVLCV